MRQLILYDIDENKRILRQLLEGENITLSEDDKGNIVISSTGGGGGGDAYYVYNQPIANSTWNIVHNLGKRPSVTSVNSAKVAVLGEVDYVNDNELNIYFKYAFAGTAYLN